jgi:hypothetical protein
MSSLFEAIRDQVSAVAKREGTSLLRIGARTHRGFARRSDATPRSVAAGLMSVCAKSSPLNGNGSPVNFASA